MTSRNGLNKIKLPVLYNCEICDGMGEIETYPAYGINAFDGAGNVIIQDFPCPCCKGEGRIRRGKLKLFIAQHY